MPTRSDPRAIGNRRREGLDPSFRPLPGEPVEQFRGDKTNLGLDLRIKRLERERGLIGEQMEDARIGTRQQYVSEWVQIVASASQNFTHGLGEVPWVLDVLTSENQDGRAPIAATSLTTAKTDTLVTVTNSGAARYFQVRAM